MRGNRLVGPETLAEIVRVFADSRDLDLAERLVLAIEAGGARRRYHRDADPRPARFRCSVVDEVAG